MRTMLTEKQWRQYLAVEAKQRGSVSQVAREAGGSPNTVKRGLSELEAAESYQPGACIRKAGGWKKKLVEIDPTLLCDLEHELDPKGDPMSLLRWTSKSLDHLLTALAAKGHPIKKSALAEVLHAQGFSLHANKKSIEGKGHPDRDAQVAHITGKCQEFEQKGAPIISVAWKKKELLGTLKNNGREWQAKGESTCVKVSDFLSLADGKAVPYGIYDLVHKSGFGNGGIEHETAEVAVESSRRWWRPCGQSLSPEQKELLITADAGGSTGAKNRLWKHQLQQRANEEPLAITLVHSPPATSKWNKIEHRLFSFISINWRATPLTSLEVVLELLCHTKTKEGLAVTAIKASTIYPPGIKGSAEELAALNLSRDPFHGAWNYTIQPQGT
jgi:DNA-binding phage protein